MSSPPIYPHDSIEEIASDVYLVRGSIKMNALMTITRNMVIVRDAGELTLVDPIRLSPAEEKQLEALGVVKQIIRLGPLHGVDDAYYLDRYGASLWAPGLSQEYPEPKPDVVFHEETPPPVPGARFFCFEGLRQPEAALLLESGRAGRNRGLLVTCDAIQNYGDYRFNNLLMRILMPFVGFPKRTIVGPLWLKMMTPEDGHLEGEFRRLLKLDFDQLISAHGSFLSSGARASCERAIEAAFKK